MSGKVEHEERHDHDHRGRSLKSVFRTYLPPWVGFALLGLAGVAVHQAWGRDAQATSLVAVLLTVATVVGVTFTRKLAHARGEALRSLAGATVVFAGAWLVAVLVFAPWRHPWLDLYALLGPLDCVLWNIYRALMSVKGEGQPGGKLGKLLDVLDGATVDKVDVEQTRAGQIVTASGSVDRGKQTVKDLQAKAVHLEALLGMRRGSVVIQARPGDAGGHKMVIIPTDTLKGEMGFTLSRPGESIAEPIRLGMYLDGRDMEITLPGSTKARRNLAHILMNGVTGAGKTETARQFVAKILTRREVAVIGSDPVKGLQTMGPFARADALELLALDEGCSRAMLDGVKRSIPPRAAYLGQRGFKQWESGCGLVYLVFWLEEADWATQSGSLNTIAKQARSVGIQLLVSQQRSSFEETDTSLRANLQGGISGGLASAMDAKFNLPDDVVDLVGDTLESWGARKPGYMIARHPSISEEDQVKPWRSDYAEDDEIYEALMEFRPYRAVMDEVTRAAFGDTYDKLRAVMTGADPAEAFGKKRAGQAVAVARPAEDDAPDDRDDPDLDDEDDEDEEAEVHDDLPPGMANVDPRTPVTHLSDPLGRKLGDQLDPPAQELTTEAFRDVVQRYLQAMLDRGATHTTTADLYRMGPPLTGRSSEWVRQELYRLEEEAGPGEIATRRDREHPRPGVFEIIAPAPPAGALSDAA